MTTDHLPELNAHEIRKFASLVKGRHGTEAIAYVIAKREEASTASALKVWDEVYNHLLGTTDPNTNWPR